MPEQVENIINKMAGTDASSATASRKQNLDGQKFYCDAKNQSQLNDFIDSAKPRLVALVGFAGYGKSTFIGSLYQFLIENLSYCGYSLVDSDTYVGFERRVFLRRSNDDNTSDTKRTVLGENDILHLKLRDGKGHYHDVLVSDKAGETYAKFTSSDFEIEKDIVLAKADLVIFFVDAEEDSGLLTAHNLIVDKYRNLLRRLSAKHKLETNTRYVIAFTKIDQVVTDSKKSKLAERKQKICAEFTSLLGCEPKKVYEVNSKSDSDKQLKELFEKVLQPNDRGEIQKNLDWVKAKIEKEQ